MELIEFSRNDNKVPSKVVKCLADQVNLFGRASIIRTLVVDLLFGFLDNHFQKFLSLGISIVSAVV